MKYFLICLFICLTVKSFGQQTVKLTSRPGTVFISDGYDEFEILTDSTLTSSLFNTYPKANFRQKNNILIITNEFQIDRTTSVVKIDTLTIIKYSSDTIIFKNRSASLLAPNNLKDTLLFVNLQRLKRPGNTFEYIEMICNTSGGGVSVSIDSSRKISYVRAPVIFNEKGENLRLKIGYLSVGEFE